MPDSSPHGSTGRPVVFFDPVPPAGVLPHDAEVHPGFGVVTLCRNGIEHRRDVKGDRTLDWYTAVVRRGCQVHKPTPVWTLHVDGPFRSLIYALTPDHGWTLIDTKDGFA